MKIAITSASSIQSEGKQELMQICRRSQQVANSLEDLLSYMDSFHRAEYEYQLPDYISHDELENLSSAVEILQELYRAIKIDLK